MSAAEKLETLDGTIHGVAGIYPPQTIESLCAALPEIIAVVKAAETLWATSVHDQLLRDENEAAMAVALAALDERLSGNFGSATEPEAPTPQ